MERRTFLKFLGLVPAVVVAAKASDAPTERGLSLAPVEKNRDWSAWERNAQLQASPVPVVEAVDEAPEVWRGNLPPMEAPEGSLFYGSNSIHCRINGEWVVLPFYDV